MENERQRRVTVAGWTVIGFRQTQRERERERERGREQARCASRSSSTPSPCHASVSVSTALGLGRRLKALCTLPNLPAAPATEPASPLISRRESLDDAGQTLRELLLLPCGKHGRPVSDHWLQSLTVVSAIRRDDDERDKAACSARDWPPSRVIYISPSRDLTASVARSLNNRNYNSQTYVLIGISIRLNNGTNDVLQ